MLAALAALPTALALGACEAAPSPVSPGASRAALHRGTALDASLAAAASGYTHLAADVTVQITGAPGLAAPGIAPQTRTIHYHLDRVRQAGGTWKSTRSFAADPSWGLPAAATKLAAANVVARVVHDPTSATAPVQLYNATGQALPFPSATTLKQQLRASSSPALAPRPITPPKVPSGGLGAGAITLQSGALASPANLPAVRAALAQNYQLTSTASDGTQHYTRTAGDTTIDLALSPTVGQLQQVTGTRAGAVVFQRSYAYTKLPSGIYVRSGVRTQQLRTGSSTPVVTAVTYSNLVVDNNGGQ